MFSDIILYFYFMMYFWCYVKMNVSKYNSAKSAINLIKNDFVVGLGSGTTVVYFIEELSKLIKNGFDIKVVPSSYQSYNLSIEYGIPLTTLDENPILDITVDGADEVDPDLNLIKGGGGALTREKIIASAAKKLVIIVDESKLVNNLGKKIGIPLEVLPFAWGSVKRKLIDLGFEPILRMASKKMGPVISDNGNFIVDVQIKNIIDDLVGLNNKLINIPGVFETGLFLNMADEVHVGTSEGSYIIKNSTK